MTEKEVKMKSEREFNSTFWTLVSGGVFILGVLSWILANDPNLNQGLYLIIAIFGVLFGGVGLIVCLILAIASRR